MIQRIKNKIRRILLKYISPDVIYVPNSYSQVGEDIIMEFLFTGVELSTPSYLELGVMRPDSGSNTYKFYTKGSRGVLVEADSTQIPLIKQIRPEDIVLNVGVGFQKEKEADFYIFDIDGLNTFDKKEAQYRSDYGSGKIIKVEKVQLKTITEIIIDNFKTFPDFLSIDIEGLDFEVLKTIDFNKHPIPVICAETCTYSENHIKPKDKRIELYLVANGYFVYADTYVNTIFVNNEWFNSAGKK